MRRSDKEIKDRNRVEEILKQAQICRIAMCQNNIPYMVPMNFGYRDGCLYFHSAKEGKKLDILRDNPLVCFEAETMIEITENEKACNWSMKYFSVIGQGKAVFLEEEQQKIKAFNIIMEKYASHSEFQYPESALQKVAVFKIIIETMTGKKSGY
ncbi:MAG: pyridoxamine 5'-phosphate oxidase family protein [Peptococcaceae bacterium]|nr:pyridoxamine 5'-phosphate oxidase family protein [Peptococcaceae bacterium]